MNLNALSNCTFWNDVSICFPYFLSNQSWIWLEHLFIVVVHNFNSRFPFKLSDFIHLKCSAFLVRVYTALLKDLSAGVRGVLFIIEPPHDKTNKMACASREDSDQPGHPPEESSLSAWRNIGASATYWTHSEDWDRTARMPSLRWAHSHFVGFVTRRLNFQRTSSELINRICIWYMHLDVTKLASVIKTDIPFHETVILIWNRKMVTVSRLVMLFFLIYQT